MQQELNDHAYMAEALRLANKGLYTTRINPRVGCVIVKDDKVIGTGYHICAGQGHAEANALNAATESVRDARVYVTLEPCSHHGNTPPCVQSLTNAKVSHVIAAMQDPNPQVNGKGFSYLKKHGIETTSGILEAEAQALNKGFIKRVTKNLPYVTVKSAVSLDGKTGLASGQSKWITCEQARLDVQKLRARSCAILTGVDTVLADNPKLTVRLSKEDLGIASELQQPLRVILDTHLRTPETANILKQTGRVVIFTCSKDKEKLDFFTKSGIEIVVTNSHEKKVDLNGVMCHLAEIGVNEILVEAGPTLIGSLMRQGYVDEMVIYMAPHFLGNQSRGLVNIPLIENMRDRIELEFIETRVVGTNIKIIAKPNLN